MRIPPVPFFHPLYIRFHVPFRPVFAGPDFPLSSSVSGVTAPRDFGILL
jgi:hypothetical protein